MKKGRKGKKSRYWAKHKDGGMFARHPLSGKIEPARRLGMFRTEQEEMQRQKEAEEQQLLAMVRAVPQTPGRGWGNNVRRREPRYQERTAATIDRSPIVVEGGVAAAGPDSLARRGITVHPQNLQPPPRRRPDDDL